MPVKIREKPNITKAVFEKKDEQCLFDTKLVSESQNSSMEREPAILQMRQLLPEWSTGSRALLRSKDEDHMIRKGQVTNDFLEQLYQFQAAYI